METLEMIQWLLALFGTGVLGCWIAYQSTLAQDIKHLLGFAENKTFKWKWWFIPGFLWNELNALAYCPYCISFWLGLLTNIILFKITLPLSILYAMLSLVSVEVWRKWTL